MGDRHGGCFARRGRALSPPRRDFPTARCGFPMARGGGQDLPARERSPRRRLPDTAHERKGLPRAETLPSAKASRHGARAKRFTRAGTRSSAKATRHGARAKRFARAGTLSSAKASRHGARAKEFAPRENAPHGEGLPTRRTSKRICPAQERSLGEGLSTRRTSERICPAQEHAPSAKASRHGARAKGFVPRGFAFAPRADERRAALDRRTAEKHPFGGVAPERARPLPSSFTEKK